MSVGLGFRTVAAQWVHLGSGKLLVAADNGAWIQQPLAGALSLSTAMRDALPSTVATTRNLLDGAIAVAEREAKRAQQPPMSARRWACHLVSQWYSAHHSVALLPELICRYDSLGRSDLASFARLKLQEEQGHDRFALEDLRALGYDAESLVRCVPPVPSVAALVRYARACARGPDPAAFLGYIYALERRVLRLTDEWFRLAAKAIPAGAPIATGLRAHATELDHEHVEQAIAFIAVLPAADRSSIARACHRTTEIACTPLAGEFLPEHVLESRLAPFTRQQRQGVTP
jgi:hypothetical protein